MRCYTEWYVLLQEFMCLFIEIKTGFMHWAWVCCVQHTLSESTSPQNSVLLCGLLWNLWSTVLSYRCRCNSFVTFYNVDSKSAKISWAQGRKVPKYGPG